MRFNKMIVITVAKFVQGRPISEAQVVQIERPVDKEGKVSFDGHWVRPEERQKNPCGKDCEYCGKDLIVKHGEDAYRCGGCWGVPTPELEYFLQVVMPAPQTVRQARINARASIQLAAMALVTLDMAR